MSFLTKIGKHKIEKDADRFLLSAQTVTVNVSWSIGNTSGTYDDVFKQYDGGEDQRAYLRNIKAEKIVVTPVTFERLDFSVIKVGDVIFRFQRDIDFKFTDLVVQHKDINYYPLIFTPDQQELLVTVLGESQLFQSIICSKVKERTFKTEKGS